MNSGCHHKSLFACCLLLVASVPALSQNHHYDDDSVIIEDSESIRAGKEFITATADDIVTSESGAGFDNVIPSNRNSDCVTSKGILGKCTSLRGCYPESKAALIKHFDSWSLGMNSPCNYQTVQGRQLYGVCCPLDTSHTAPNITKFDGLAYYPQISNWPPPIPTHPPDHTIPPLPTHPPAIMYPTTTSWPPAWPPSTVKPNPVWPPQATTPKPSKPTRPTTIATTTPGLPATGSCGLKNGYQDQERIVGGHNADVGEWPWIAALFNGGRQFCGGSLIDNVHILSAAHCVAHMSSWDVARLTVRLGDHNIKTNSEVRHIEKRVKRIVRHRGFDPRTLYNDISILTLDTPVQFTQQIRPICLPSSGSTYAGLTGTVIGWGSLRESGPQPSILQEVNIQIWSNQNCQLKYGPAAPGGIVEHMLCAGQAAKDSCSGDSGGPLMVNTGKWTQVGIVSWGIGCGKGQYPGVYTRVDRFLPWIQKNTK